MLIYYARKGSASFQKPSYHLNVFLKKKTRKKEGDHLDAGTMQKPCASGLVADVRVSSCIYVLVDGCRSRDGTKSNGRDKQRYLPVRCR
jgi:hypothetical protein